MKLVIDESMKRVAEDFVDAAIHGMHNNDTPVPPGWTSLGDKSYDFPKDPDLLNAFTVGAKYLQSTSFGKDLLEEWRDERADYKADDPSYSMADFMDDLGYLENFTGRNLTQLMKYYLSPRGISDGAWLHSGTMVSDDGKYIAHSFVPLAFREHDEWLWFQDAATGHGIAVEFDTL